VAPEELCIPAPMAGLNHCAFMTDLRLRDGRSAFPLVLEHTDLPIVRWGLETYGLLPYCWSHVTEFFPMLSQLEEPYTGKLQGLAMRYGLHVHDMAHERERGERWARLADEWSRGVGEPVSLNVLPSAEAIEVVDLIEALHTRGQAIHGLNLPNGGAIANLPADAIVEVSAVVGAYGVQPIQMGPLPEALAAILRQHITAQQLTAQAALSGDRHTLLHAFLADPQTQARLGQPEMERMVDELLAAHRAHLPQFA